MQHDICIVGLKCRDLLVGRDKPRYLGGIEQQLVGLARELARRGLRVAVVTYRDEKADSTDTDGVSLVEAYSPDAGVPGLRFFHPRSSGFLQALDQADARIYLQMGGGAETGLTALNCRWRGQRSRFVFLAASDGDCTPDLPFLPTLKERLVYRWGLRRADRVLVQTARQSALLRQHYNLETTQLPLSTSLPQHDTTEWRARWSDGPARFLWVGRFVPEKRLELLLEIAAAAPDLGFDIVGSANAESAYSRDIAARAEAMQNVTVHGKVSFTVLRELYRASRALCCTSRIEGFPNTFLEAWSIGLPVVTTFDPDDIVASNAVGLVADDAESLERRLREVAANEEDWLAVQARVDRYYADTHSIEAVTDRFLEGLEIGE